MDSALLASPYSSSLYSNRPNPTDVFIRRDQAHLVFFIMTFILLLHRLFQLYSAALEFFAASPIFVVAVVGFSKLVFGFWGIAMFR